MISKLFKIAFRRQVLPEPTSPVIPISSPYWALKVILSNRGIVCSLLPFFLLRFLFSFLIIPKSMFSILIAY